MNSEVPAKKRKGNKTPTQKQMLLDFVQLHPHLHTGKFTAVFTHAIAQSLWEQITIILNAVPGGGIKDWKQWRKCFHDDQTFAKTKESNHQEKTGGGPAMITQHTDYENQILNLIGETRVTGQKDTPTSSIEMIWTDAAEDNLSNEGVENNKEEPIIIIDAERSEMLTPHMTPAKTTKKANITETPAPAQHQPTQ